MSKFIEFDGAGKLMARFDDLLALPSENAIEVDEELWVRTVHEVDGEWTLNGDGSISKKPFPEMEPDYVELIAAARFAHEKNGITVKGLFIDTDRDSQSLITAAALSAYMDSAYMCNWKTSKGFVQINAATLLEISKAVRSYVQSCFDREAELRVALHAGTFEQSMLAEGWPA